MSAAVTRAAIRGLAMPHGELENKLATCSESTREKLVAELGAIQWALAMCLVWFEQGVLDDVFGYIKSQCAWTVNDGKAEVPTGV